MQLGTMAYAVIIFSRYLLAQSMDRFLPSKLAYVSPRFGSPVVAHLVDLVITLALIGITAYFFENISGIFGAIIASMIYFVFIGLAATKHALQKEKGTTKVVLRDRKSTRLNSSHLGISYAVFCLKKKNK